MKNLYYIVFLFALVSSCKKPLSNIDGYSLDKNGFYYQLLSIGDEKKQPANTQYVLVKAEMFTLSDSIFWDTTHDTENGLFVDLSGSVAKKSCNAYFLKSAVGDSVSFYVNTAVFFKDYFNSPIPPFCQKDSLVKMNVRIIHYLSKNEYEKLKINSETKIIEDLELQELQTIDAFVTKNYDGITPDGYGIYWIDKEETNGEQVTWGKKINIEFQGYHLDGRPIAQGRQTMEFSYGTPDQIINGLNIVIGSLKNGEIAKIIVPSRLAFGEKGNSNGTIKPYTPLLFEIKITNVQPINP